MATITLVDGTHLHIRPDQITIIGEAGPYSKLSGFGSGKLDVQQDAVTLLDDLDLTDGFAQFEAPDGTVIWINKGAVSMVRAPIGEAGHAVLLVAGTTQAVNEDVLTAKNRIGL